MLFNLQSKVCVFVYLYLFMFLNDNNLSLHFYNQGEINSEAYTKWSCLNEIKNIDFT